MVQTEEKFRSPIVAVLGHVDSGKTTLLDYIRKTRVAVKEPGRITQHVGCSEIPLFVLEKICEPVFRKFNFKQPKLKGLIFIDLPGHEVFTNLRKRGGSVADIAILVIDIKNGVQQQTIESLEILKARKTPFVISLNKLDTVEDWKSVEGVPFIASIKDQTQKAISNLENAVYQVIDQLGRLGFNAERYDRIQDFTKQFPIVPTSAVTGEGVPDLLAVLVGLTQKYMLDRLKLSMEETRGVILEVKKERGLGVTIDVLLYDGVLKQGDLIVLGGKNGVIKTYVKGIFRPKPLDEMRAPSEKFTPVKEVNAAAGVKITAPTLGEAMPGSPLYATSREERINELAQRVKDELEQILIKSESDGFIVKADTLGSLEALSQLIRNLDQPIRRADIGTVTEKDIFEAEVMKLKNPLYGCILAFNVKPPVQIVKMSEEHGVKILYDNIIYKLIEKLKAHIEAYEKEKEKLILEKIVFPCKIQILKGYVFRRSKPAIVGIKVLEGKLKPGTQLMDERGKEIGYIHMLQDKGRPIPIAEKGAEVAASIIGGVVGRNIFEDQILYSIVQRTLSEEEKEYLRKHLSDEEKKLLKMIWKMKS